MSQLQLEGKVTQEYVEDHGSDALEQLSQRIEELEVKLSHVKRDAVVMVLNLLAESLRHVASGKMDIPEVQTATAPQFDPKWELWKQKLGGTTAPARVIQALLEHGPLNRTQLRSAAELGWSTLDAATARLKNLSLIEKVGDRWQLKG